MAPKERFLRAFTPNNTNPDTTIPTCMMHWRIIAAVMIRIMQLERSLAMKINRVPNVFFRERFSCRYIRLVKRDFDRFARLISAPAQATGILNQNGSKYVRASQPRRGPEVQGPGT